MAGKREDPRLKFSSFDGQASYPLSSKVSPDALPSGVSMSPSGTGSGAIHRGARHTGLDSGISSSGYMESTGQHSSQFCPSYTQADELTQKEIFSSIYRILDEQDRRTQRVLREKMDFIKKYYYRLPVELKTGYFDAMILYSSTDFEDAEVYRKHLKSLDMDSGREVKAVLWDGPELESLPGSKFQHLGEAFRRCTFVFVYLTKQFCESEWCQLSSEECLMESIYNPDRKWCVVPVYTVQRSKADFRIPMGLNSLKGVNYYNNDDFYRRGLKKLIGDKLFIREMHEQNLLDEQYKFARGLEVKDLEKLKKNEDLIRQKSHSPESKRPSHYGLQNQKSWPQSEFYPTYSHGFRDEDEQQDEETTEHISTQPHYPDHVAPVQRPLEAQLRNLSVSPLTKFEPSPYPPSVQHTHSQRTPLSLATSSGESSGITQPTSHPTSNVPPSTSSVPGHHDDVISSEHESLSGSSSIMEDQYPSYESEPQDEKGNKGTSGVTSSTYHEKSANGQAEVVKIEHVHHHYYHNQKKVVNIVNASNVVVGDKGNIISETPGTVVDLNTNDDVGEEAEETKSKLEKSGEISLDDNSIDAGSTVMPKVDDLENLTPRGSKNSSSRSLHDSSGSIHDVTSTKNLQSPTPENRIVSQNIPAVGVSCVQRQTSVSNNGDDKTNSEEKIVPVVTAIRPKREVNFSPKNVSNKPVAVAKPFPKNHCSEDEDDNISGDDTFLNDFSQTHPKVLYSEETAVKNVANEETFVKQPHRGSLNQDSSLETDCPLDEIETIKARNIALDTSLYNPGTAILTADDKQISAVVQLLAMDYEEEDIKFALETLRRARPGHVHFSINNMLDILEKKEAASSSVDPTSQGDSRFSAPVREFDRQRSVSEENLHQNHQKPKTDFHKSDTDLDLTTQNKPSLSKHSSTNKEKCCIS